MRPMMTKKEVSLMEMLLLKQATYANNDIDVLEWGSGGSTVYYTNFLRENKVQYTWTSIEYNKVWHDKITEMVKEDPNTEVVLFDVGNTKLKQRKIPMDEYVNFPSQVKGEGYDLILVDGRKRRRCLLEAANLVKPTGVVVLHDAEREYYHCAFQAYKSGEFLAHKLWVGKVS